MPRNGLILSQVNGIPIVIRRTNIDNYLEDTITTMYRIEAVGIDTCRCNRLTTPVECRTRTELLVFGKDIVRVNGQTQYESTIITVNRAICLVVVAT